MQICVAFVFLAFATSAAVGQATCPSSLPPNVSKKIFGDKCYFFTIAQKSVYKEAEKRCEEFSGTLALPKTAAINNFLATNIQALAPNKQFWIGLNDERQEDVFDWEDGTTLNHKTNFNRFDLPDEGPRDGLFQKHVEDCVGMDAKGLWHDHFCGFTSSHFLGVHLYYVCEVAAIGGSVSTTAPSAVSTTDSSAGSTIEAVATCGPFTCDIDCGLQGYKMEPNGCFLCQCDE